MEQFRNALITKYYRNTDGIIFVFDITRRETFESLENWVKEVRKYVSSLDSVRMMLVGNKKDKEYARKVSGAKYALLACGSTNSDLILSQREIVLSHDSENFCSCYI